MIGVQMVILAYAGLTEHLNQRNAWVVCHICEPTITYTLITGPTLKESPRPKPRLMTMEEVDSNYNPNEDK